MSGAIQRTGKGTYAPGVTGNAGGRPRKDENDREAHRIFRAKGPWAANRIISMAENRGGRYSESTELAAVQHILDRALGKVQVHENAHLAGVQFIVQQYTAPAGPVPGVLASPVQQHISPPRLIGADGEVIEASQ